MKIRRSAARNYSGWTNLAEGDPRAIWDVKGMTLEMHLSNIPGKNHGSSYNYKACLSLSDVVAILHTLSTDGLRSSEPSLQKALAACSRDLLRLTNASAAVPSEA